MRPAPNHSTATLDRFSTSSTIGNMNAWRRPAASAVAVTSSFTRAKRWASAGSRTKARTTRMPVICSRRTSFSPSIRSCMTRNWGTMRHTTRPMERTRTGTETVMIHERPMSSRSARMMPPTQVIGAAISRTHVMRTNICTCCTSFVMRVMSEGAPNLATSRDEKSDTWWNRPLRTSRPKAMAVRDPK